MIFWFNALYYLINYVLFNLKQTYKKTQLTPMIETGKKTWMVHQKEYILNLSLLFVEHCYIYLTLKALKTKKEKNE